MARDPLARVFRSYRSTTDIGKGVGATVMNYELEFLASERLRERRHEAAHERMAGQFRRPAARRSGSRRLHWRAAFALVRRLVRVAQAA